MITHNTSPQIRRLFQRFFVILHVPAVYEVLTVILYETLLYVMRKHFKKDKRLSQTNNPVFYKTFAEKNVFTSWLRILERHSQINLSFNIRE